MEHILLTTYVSTEKRRLIRLVRLVASNSFYTTAYKVDAI